MAADRIVERLVVAIKYVVDQAGLRNSLSSYTQISGAIGAASLAVAGFTIAQAAQLDEVAKTARSLSLTTEEYTALAHAANIGGVSQQGLSTALRSLTLKLGAARAGAAETRRDFEHLGIAWKTADGDLRTATDLLPEIADALMGMSEGDAAAIRLRLLGRSGLEMASFMEGGSASIRELTAEAAELGVVLDSKTAASAERLTDSVTRMWAIVKGFGFQLAGVLMPRLADVIDSFVDWAKANDGILRSGIERGVQAIGIALDYLATPAGKVAAGMVAIGAAIGTGQAAGGVIGAMRMASPVINAMAASMGGLSASMALPLLGAVGLALVLEDLWVTSQGGDSVTRRLAAAFGVEDEVVGALADTVDLLTAATGPLLRLMKEVADIGLTQMTTGFREWIRIGKATISVHEDLATSLGDLLTLGFGVENSPLFRLFEWLKGVLPTLSSAADGFRKLGRFMAGDARVTVRQPTSLEGQIQQQLATPFLAVANRARDRAQSGGGITVAPTINVNAGASKAEIRAESFRVFGQELDMALSTSGVL